MINVKQNLRHRLMAIRFILWDLHLYTDTHENDCEAKELIKKYNEQYEELLKAYECKYGSLTALGETDGKWTTMPFPWDNSGSDC